ncbi:MAG TPA: hypothetical protein PLT04_05225 [Candidatus Saccharibacteria bacterium]|nr:hypothetical protein [Candidatus Saccharibacteria bacterium]
MARYIRPYDIPEHANSASILGFSLSVTEAAYDPTLHDWLKERNYTVVQESDAQKTAHIVLPKMGALLAGVLLEKMKLKGIRPSSLDVSRAAANHEYYTAPSIPLPPDSVSAAHLLVEPPLRNEDLQPLGLCLSSLAAVRDDGLRRHFFVDSRGQTPTAYSRDEVIYAWGQTF